MSLETKLNGLTGSELINKLIIAVNGEDYSEDGRIWDNSDIGIKNMIWSVAGLNKLEHNTKFKREWLKLPISIKKEIGAAIRKLNAFQNLSNNALRVVK